MFQPLKVCYALLRAYFLVNPYCIIFKKNPTKSKNTCLTCLSKTTEGYDLTTPYPCSLSPPLLHLKLKTALLTMKQKVMT